MKTSENFEKVFESFIKIVNEVTSPLPDKPSIITVERGRKFIKIVSQYFHAPQKGVYCFVDLEGNILKAESWTKPHPKPRGNIYNEDRGRSAITQYGANYLK